MSAPPSQNVKPLESPADSHTSGDTIPDNSAHAERRISRSRVEVIGQIIHNLRRDRMTLAELAKRSGVSVGILSRLENGIGNPSFRVLHSVAGALNVHVSALFHTETTPDFQLVKAEDRLRIRLPASVTDYEVLVPDLDGNFIAYLWNVPRSFAGSSHKSSHLGDEFILVRRGRLELHVGSEVFQLDTGDSVTFDSSRPHWLRNLSTRSAEVLVAMTPAGVSTDTDQRGND
jgi:transcriptional regulator with XRE-family HTH domain